jgi:hypothetical protein
MSQPQTVTHRFLRTAPAGMMLGKQFRTFRSTPKELIVKFNVSRDPEDYSVLTALEVNIDGIWYTARTLEPLSMRTANGIVPYLDYLEDRAAKEMGLVRGK